MRLTTLFLLVFWITCLVWGAQTLHALDQPLFVSDPRNSVAAVSLTSGTATAVAHQAASHAQRLANIHNQASTRGLDLGIESRRAGYLRASTYGLEGRLRISEQIGEMGARAYARKMGFIPIHESVPGRGRGFDQVYRHGEQVVVIEAKGGSARAREYRGARQGSVNYALAVAGERLMSPNASPQEKLAAREVIRAHQQGRLVLQTASTEHVYGEPRKTRVQTTHGRISGISGPLSAHRIGIVAGIGGGILTVMLDGTYQLSQTGTIDSQRLAGAAGQGLISTYGGTRAGIGVSSALRQPEMRMQPTSRVIPVGGFLAGGMAAGAIYSYAGYFLGTTDLETAHQSMRLTAIGSAAGAATYGGMMATVSTIGVASTGAPISSLSGAAASKATLAWFGGGSLASGGGGVALGKVVVAVPAVGAVILAPAAIITYQHLQSEQEERSRISNLITAVESHCFEHGCSN